MHVVSLVDVYECVWVCVSVSGQGMHVASSVDVYECVWVCVSVWGQGMDGDHDIASLCSGHTDKIITFFK